MRIMLIVRMPLIPSFHLPFFHLLHLFGYYGQVKYFRMLPHVLLCRSVRCCVSVCGVCVSKQCAANVATIFIAYFSGQ